MFRTIGSRTVSPLGLGGAAWSIFDERDDERSIATIHAALDAGIRLIDTARAYTADGIESHNEQLIARALATYDSPTEDVLIVTKGGHFRAPGSVWREDGSAPALRADCERSLQALGRDQLDLYLLHKPDATIAIEESVDALAELQREGLVALIGVSNVDESQLARALSVAPLDAVENRFSPFDQNDRAVLERTESLGLAYLAYSPLGSGTAAATDRSRFALALAVASAARVSPQQLWLAWLLRQSPVILPVVGATRPQTIVDSAAAASLTLADDVWQAIDTELAHAFSPAPA